MIRPRQQGFTLIELLVVIVIIGLMVTGAMAAYYALNARQAALSTARDIQLIMRQAQKKARAGDRPAGCLHLLGYTVANSGQTVQTTAICPNGTYTVGTYTIASGIQVTTNFSMAFSVLQGGVTGAGSVTTKSQFWQYGFTVDPGGSITEPVAQ